MQTIHSTFHLLAATLVVAVALVTPAHPVSAKGVEVAHVWRFTYQAHGNQGILDVTIVEQDPYTHEIINIIDEFTYPVPCTQNRGQIVCDLDIQSAIKDSYYQLDLKDRALRVRPSESYREIFVEATGTWSTNLPQQHTTVVSHPSLQFAVETFAGNQARFTSAWDVHTTTSNRFKPINAATHTMRNYFVCRPNADCTIENTVTINQQERDLGTTTMAGNLTTGFQTSAAQITITPPPAFQLDTLVIDPPKAGYG